MSRMKFGNSIIILLAYIVIKLSYKFYKLHYVQGTHTNPHSLTPTPTPQPTSHHIDRLHPVHHHKDYHSNNFPTCAPY